MKSLFLVYTLVGSEIPVFKPSPKSITPSSSFKNTLGSGSIDAGFGASVQLLSDDVANNYLAVGIPRLKDQLGQVNLYPLDNKNDLDIIDRPKEIKSETNTQNYGTSIFKNDSYFYICAPYRTTDNERSRCEKFSKNEITRITKFDQTPGRKIFKDYVDHEQWR